MIRNTKGLSEGVDLTGDPAKTGGSHWPDHDPVSFEVGFMKQSVIALLGGAVLVGLFVAEAKSENPPASQRGFTVFPIGTVEKAEGRTAIVLDNTKILFLR